MAQMTLFGQVIQDQDFVLQSTLDGDIIKVKVKVRRTRKACNIPANETIFEKNVRVERWNVYSKKQDVLF
jgi:hypothetical protein